MLTIYGQRHRFCDGISRRNFLNTDLSGRPHFIVDGHQPMKELI